MVIISHTIFDSVSRLISKQQQKFIIFRCSAPFCYFCTEVLSMCLAIKDKETCTANPSLSNQSGCGAEKSTTETLCPEKQRPDSHILSHFVPLHHTFPNLCLCYQSDFAVNTFWGRSMYNFIEHQQKRNFLINIYYISQ